MMVILYFMAKIYQQMLRNTYANSFPNYLIKIGPSTPIEYVDK